MKDLVCLVADGEMEAAVKGFFENPAFERKLECKKFTFTPQGDLIKHPRNDPGVYHEAHHYLRGYLETHQYAVVMLDRECGLKLSANEMRQDIHANMMSAGWPEDRFHIVVIEPELEAFAWQENTRALEQALGYQGDEGSLRQWIADQGHWPVGEPSPADPKTALDHIIGSRLSGKRKARSAVFRNFAKNASLRHCSNDAFGALQLCLQGWFVQEYAAA